MQWFPIDRARGSVVAVILKIFPKQRRVQFKREPSFCSSWLCGNEGRKPSISEGYGHFYFLISFSCQTSNMHYTFFSKVDKHYTFLPFLDITTEDIVQMEKHTMHVKRTQNIIQITHYQKPKGLYRSLKTMLPYQRHDCKVVTKAKILFFSPVQ